MNKPSTLAMAVLLTVSALPTWAADMSMEGMDHSQMEGMDHSTTPAKDDGKMDDDMKGMDHGSMSGSMSGSMQGGSAPADARDPHAYSDGYSIESGKYALPGKRQFVLADEHNFGMLLVDRLESVRSSGNSSATYDVQGWYGRDYDRLVFKAEGDVNNGTLEESSTDVVWSHAVATFWDAQLGLRFDSSDGGPDRNWLALGMQGLAPYWFELDVTAYLGDSGRSTLSVDAEYEVLITQKLILQPRLEANFYGKDDFKLGIGSGLTDVTAGLRLRYEFRREFAPYVGVEWAGTYGNTADLVKAAGLDSKETRVVAGVRFWF